MAIAENLKKQNKEFIILSDRHYSFFDDFSVNVELVKESPEDYLAKYSPEVVLTATSYTSKLELEFILAAKKKAIRTIVFVDHWTSINERFDFKGSDILPDDLLLIDDKAYRHAVKNNIPESICTIYGHPYHDFSKSWILSKYERNRSKMCPLSRRSQRESHMIQAAKNDTLIEFFIFLFLNVFI